LSTTEPGLRPAPFLSLGLFLAAKSGVYALIGRLFRLLRRIFARKPAEILGFGKKAAYLTKRQKKVS